MGVGEGVEWGADGGQHRPARGHRPQRNGEERRRVAREVVGQVVVVVVVGQGYGGGMLRKAKAANMKEVAADGRVLAVRDGCRRKSLRVAYSHGAIYNTCTASTRSSRGQQQQHAIIIRTAAQ